MFTYKSNSCEKKKAKNGYTEKPKTFFENKKMETLKKKKIATIDGPHYSPMKKKWAHKKKQCHGRTGQKRSC